MRDRVERKEAEAATPGAPTPAPNAIGPNRLLALQRSAGNAAVVAMLNGGGPARPAPDPPRVSSRPDGTIRRLWTQRTEAPGAGINFEIMNTAKFEALILGPGVVRDLIHDEIQDLLDGYLEAVEGDHWELADATLDLMESTAKLWLWKDPVGKNPKHPATKGMNRFLDACKREKEDVSVFLELTRLHGGDAAAATSSRPPQRPAGGSSSSGSAAAATAGTRQPSNRPKPDVLPALSWSSPLRVLGDGPHRPLGSPPPSDTSSMADPGELADDLAALLQEQAPDATAAEIELAAADVRSSSQPLTPENILDAVLESERDDAGTTQAADAGGDLQRPTRTFLESLWDDLEDLQLYDAATGARLPEAQQQANPLQSAASDFEL